MLSSEEVRAVMQDMPKGLVAAEAEGIDATVLFELHGEAGGRFYITVRDGVATVSEHTGPTPATTLRLSAEDYFEMAHGRRSGQELFLSGRMTVEGSVGLGMRLESMFRPRATEPA